MSTETITQRTLKEFYTKKRLIKELTERVEFLDKKLVKQLKSGAKIQNGKFSIGLHEGSGIYIEWKEAYRALCKEKKEDFELREAKLRKKTKAKTFERASVTQKWI